MNGYLEDLRVNFGNAQVIKKRENGIVIRWPVSRSIGSIIIKLWSRSGLKGKLRRSLRITSCNHEWRSLLRMHAAGIAVPRPLGFCSVLPDIAGYIDVLFMEDLGECVSATDHLKRLIQSGQDAQALAFENVLISMTEQILNAGMVDMDHGMNNIVVTASGRPVKLDVELARRVVWPRLFPGMYGRMLGRLIGLHTFAVQPDVDRTVRFAERLCERLNPPRRVLRRASRHIQELMRGQFEKTGIDTRIILPWDRI